LSPTSVQTIAARFGQAAETYDAAASVQARLARTLVQKAIRGINKVPACVLDIGCGTGFVATHVAREWPWTSITAIDSAPAMLDAAQRKIPNMRVISGDAGTRDFGPSFDLILSGMALHWLNNPCAALERWRGWLKPGGKLFTALPVAGSFAEWRQLCADYAVPDGLWVFPEGDFAARLNVKTEIETLPVDYPSAHHFLGQIKATGAATPHPDYRPMAAGTLRRLLARAPQPFTITYKILYMEMQSPGSI